MSETYLVRMNGGPLPGTRLFDAAKTPWPPPDELPAPGCKGRYVKVSQSDITDDEIQDMSHVVRAAEYEWRRRSLGGPVTPAAAPDPAASSSGAAGSTQPPVRPAAEEDTGRTGHHHTQRPSCS